MINFFKTIIPVICFCGMLYFILKIVMDQIGFTLKDYFGGADDEEK